MKKSMSAHVRAVIEHEDERKQYQVRYDCDHETCHCWSSCMCASRMSLRISVPTPLPPRPL